MINRNKHFEERDDKLWQRLRQVVGWQVDTGQVVSMKSCDCDK